MSTDEKLSPEILKQIEQALEVPKGTLISKSFTAGYVAAKEDARSLIHSLFSNT